ncbi:DinB family protein [Patiriisocius sp. Uisw_017]|jgi:hypothetical protein|uniref:DinB family protein n=1 Tax=Patiriisocius sp. Uisw_017 TaxID=3230968 RepID=UPI0039EBE24C
MKKSQLTTNQFLPYYSLYVNLVGDIHIEKALTDGMLKTVEFFEGIPSDKASFAYEDGKWTSKEILLHLIDTERVFSYRALSISRSSVTNLPSFDQDEFVLNSKANDRDMDSLIKEYIATRTATIYFFSTITIKTQAKVGRASGGPLSAGAAGFIICGHEIHHCNVISERYL